MRTLLLADDNITVQRVIALTFAQEPVRIVTASDGHQAMDRVVVDRPDIVLAGTTLPHVNGYELSRFVKSKPESKDVPVLLLSGAFESIDEAQLVSSGANGVIEKPVEPTDVIRRVKELLGLKSRDAAPAAGRLVTPATVAAGQRAAPTLPRAVTTSRPMPSAARDERRAPTSDENARPAGASTGGDDYLESLGDAFDTLDQQLEGRKPTDQRNPSPPLGQLHQTGDPRSPGRVPAPQSAPPPQPGNPVYEVDEDWFGDTPSRDDARAGRRDMADELRAPELPAGVPPMQPVYEVDDEWFAEDQKARDARQLEQRELAREMGIHEVKLPEPAPAPPPLARDDFEFGEADLSAAIATGHIEPPKVTEPPTVVEPPTAIEPPTVVESPTAMEPPKVPEAPRGVETPVTPIVEVVLASAVVAGQSEALAPAEPAAVIEMTLSAHRDEEPRPSEPIARTLPIDFFAAATAKEGKRAFLDSSPEPRRDTRDVADDFDALLAFEQGKNATPPMIEPIIHAVTPEITSGMIEEIATTVADRLRDHVPAPEITGEVIKTIAFLVSRSLKDHIRVEPVAPQITGEMLDRISATVSDRLRHTITIEAVAPELTPPMLEQVAATVAGHLKDSIRVEPVEPQITQPMLDHIAAVVADRLTHSIRVEPAAPQITEPMLEHIASFMSGRLADSIRVEPAAPKISEQMLDHIAAFVSERLKNHIHIEPVPPPQVSHEVASHVAEQLAERLTASVHVQTVAPEITGEMLEQMAARVSERLQTAIPPAPEPPQITGDMLEHVAARVSERVQSAMPPPPAPPQITDDMLERVAGRVAERVQGSFSIDQLRDSIAGAVRDTVRAVVSETSERLVREEIERIRSKTP